MNTELHQRTVETLVKLVDVLDCDELSLLCWHCGVSVTELMPTEEMRPLSGELFAAYIEKDIHHEIQH